MNTMIEVVNKKIDEKLQKSQPDAQAAMQSLVDDGKVMKDYLAPIGVKHGFNPDITFGSNGHVLIEFLKNTYSLHDNALGQLAEKFKIPSRYLKDLSVGQEWGRKLSAKILNEHSLHATQERVLIRAVGEQVRGVLSDSYKRIDSPMIVKGFLTESYNSGAVLADGHKNDLQVWVEVILPEVIIIPTENNGEIPICFGARLSTSDFGKSATEVRAFMLQGICLNGWVRESMLRQIHLGKKLPYNLGLSEKTMLLDTKTQISAVRDITKRVFDTSIIKNQIEVINSSSNMIIDLKSEIENSLKNVLIKDEVEELEYVFMANRADDGVTGESTLWKLTQGITAIARDKSQERKRELQEFAGGLFKRVEK